jgi:FlaA1/EpsC-like NDP-sugar epimerase
MAVGVERFIMISSDKAVNPTSVMGVSKRVAELLVYQAARAARKPYVAVRFGNVLGSRGSVVHTFRRQIAEGGPITITHPDMTRYFMTIPEAVQLVLQAAVLGRGGEAFLLDMGEPVKIVDLAKDLIELSGLEVGSDIDIIFTSVRPGEKLYEELFVPGENYRRTCHEKIFVADSDSAAPDAALSGRHALLLSDAISQLEEAARSGDRLEMLRIFKAIVPQYRTAELEWQPEEFTLDLPASPAALALEHG